MSCSSPIVAIGSKGLNANGDCVDGPGDVSAELDPRFDSCGDDNDATEGEPVEAFPSKLGAEPMLALEPWLLELKLPLLRWEWLPPLAAAVGELLPDTNDEDDDCCWVGDGDACGCCRRPTDDGESIATSLDFGVGVFIGGPGKEPNAGNSNEKLTSPLLITDDEPSAVDPVDATPESRARGAVFNAMNRFLYSSSSTFIRLTSARSCTFSWSDCMVVCFSSSTLSSKSLRCFSLRSRNAR